MRLGQKIWRNVIVLFVFLLGGYFLSHSNLAQDVKGMGKKTPKLTVNYLGSVPLEASLADLVPKQDKEMVQLKEEWLKIKMDSRVRHEMAVSENGRYKVLKTFFPDPVMEGAVDATFVDDNGQEIWKGTTGSNILVSNNGKNFSAKNPVGGLMCFYDVTSSSEPSNCIEPSSTYGFSENGDYFITANRKLTLYSADGKLIWEKDTGTESKKRVAINSNASYIVMASSSVFGHPEPKITNITVTEKVQDLLPNPPIPSSKRDEEKIQKLRRETIEKKKNESLDKPSSRKEEWKIYLCFFQGNGTLIKQKTLPYRVVQHLKMSLDGGYVAVSSDSTVLFFETKTGTLLWKYEFPNIYWVVTSIAISSNGDLIALGVNSNRGDRLSKRYIYLLNKKGDVISNFELKKPTASEKQPLVTFTETDKYVLVATSTSKYCIITDYID